MTHLLHAPAAEGFYDHHNAVVHARRTTVARYYSDSDRVTIIDDLLALLHPAWHARAVCRAAPGETVKQAVDRMFTTSRQHAAEQLCQRCPVRTECREAGRGASDGIWGGESKVRGR